MARRMLAWALVTPVSAAGILAAHALAYALTGTQPGAVHGYLSHVPQVIAVLATLGVVGLAVQQRGPARAPALVFVVVAPLGFACQEHVERLVHSGELPWLLTTPQFALGLALQIPVGLLSFLVARRVVGTLRDVRRACPAGTGEAWLPLPERPVSRPRPVRLPRAAGRGPPALSVP